MKSWASHWILIASFIVLLFISFAANGSAKVLKESFISHGKSRTVYLFVPETVKPTQPAPLIVLLHGSGHNGLSLVDKWKDLAAREGVIIAGPDSADPSIWSPVADGPDVLRDLVEQLRSKYPINSRQIYLFGHSGGAVYALTVAMLQSEYFAATAVHAGAWRQTQEYQLPKLATRKIPIAIWVGTNDQFFSLKAVHATRDALQAEGFPIEVTEMPGHDHWYYDLAPRINQSAWDFLKDQKLTAEPRFVDYPDESDTARANNLIQTIDTLRKKAYELEMQAKGRNAELQTGPGSDRSETGKLARIELELLKQSAAIWLEAADKAEQAGQLKLSSGDKQYLSLIAQHNRKHAEIVAALQEQAEVLISDNSDEVIQAKRNEIRQLVEKLQHEADQIQAQMRASQTRQP